jgi:5'-nucleotidase
MHILLSNDDGCQATGLQNLQGALTASFSRNLEVTVVAPDRDRSGASNSLTLQRPLNVSYLNNSTLCVDGTPTDCVHLAVTGLLKNTPDMVVSGINAGANMGDDVLYSGTVAAAIEGRSLGFPAIAVSLVGHEHYATAASVVVAMVRRLISNPLPSDTILNINVPDVPEAELNGFVSTRLGRRHPACPMVENVDPRGKKVYWVGSVGEEQDAGEGTDFYAIRQQQVSVTPIQIDLTRHERTVAIADWLNGLE